MVVSNKILKFLIPLNLGDFNLQSRDLREKRLNRIGNLLIPNENYYLFEGYINSL